MSNPLKSFRRLLPRALGAWLALAFVLLSIVLTLVLTAVIERKSSEQVETNIGQGLAELAITSLSPDGRSGRKPDRQKYTAASGHSASPFDRGYRAASHHATASELWPRCRLGFVRSE